MRRLQVRILSGVLGRVVELVDTRHLNCLSPKGECGFDSRPDYKIFGYAIPLTFTSSFLLPWHLRLLSIGQIANKTMEDPYTTIRLGRLLHYRDKAKALDQFMSKKINAKQLMERYDKIEEDKKKWKDGARNH